MINIIAFIMTFPLPGGQDQRFTLPEEVQRAYSDYLAEKELLNY